jgi:hypothetical protein
MSKFTKVEAKSDITFNSKLLARKGTKGTILDVLENNLYFVRFSTGKLMTISSRFLLAN